ncbi:MAG: molybdate ABC transporter substrate-binding protein [Clostridiales bacterium]|nr:molybdate ABC transporter substrate-binding protein [Clostridiales bacterium]
MKKTLALLLVFLLFSAAFACGAPDVPDPPTRTESPATPAPTPEPTVVPTPEPLAIELTIFAAASMTEVLEEIAEVYRKIAPNVTLIFDFDSSGTLLTRLNEGAYADIFISAAQKQMDAPGSGILSDSRINLVENKVVLVVPAGNPGNIQSFADIAECKSLAIGNADVPVGQYAQELLTNLCIWDDALFMKTTYGSNAKEVTTWVMEGVVECGIVYATDALSAGLTIIDFASTELLQTPALYPAAVLKITEYEEAAREFLAFLQTPAVSQIFSYAGFMIPQRTP